MEPVLWPSPFDDPSFSWEVKWDGIRLLTWRSPGRLEAVTRRGRRADDRYPELEELPRVDAVWDGEMVVLRGGKADFPSVLARHFGRKGLSATYMVFDLLYWKGRDLRREPYEVRRSLLLESLPPDLPHVAKVESFPGEEGTRLFRAVEALGWEGLVGKRKDSPYRPGLKGAWRKVKAFRLDAFWVGGWLPHGGSFLLGRDTPEGLLYVGKVAYPGGPEPTLRRREDPPFLRLPPFRERPLFFEPTRKALIRYLEWTADGRLRAPTWKGWVWDTSK